MQAVRRQTDLPNFLDLTDHLDAGCQTEQEYFVVECSQPVDYTPVNGVKANHRVCDVCAAAVASAAQPGRADEVEDASHDVAVDSLLIRLSAFYIFE